MTAANTAPLCPGCFKGNIRQLYDGKWRCKYVTCKLTFDKPMYRQIAKVKPKGIPAGKCISRQYRWNGSRI